MRAPNFIPTPMNGFSHPATGTPRDKLNYINMANMLQQKIPAK